MTIKEMIEKYESQIVWADNEKNYNGYRYAPGYL